MKSKARFHVIPRSKKEEPPYYMLYLNAFINATEEALDRVGGTAHYTLDDRKKIILYGVKMINACDRKHLSYKEPWSKLQLILFLKQLMGKLTPRELQTIFPIAKEYDGDKYGMKDYFFTRNHIKEFGEDKVIGEHIAEFLWDYHNREIRRFVVNLMGIISDIRRAKGGKGLAEEFCKKLGIATYTLCESNNGKKNHDKQQQVLRVKRPRPRYLRPL